MTLQAKTSAESATVLSQVMSPAQANPFMTVHGGELLKLMDTAAGVCASRHQEGSVNTKALGGVVFHAPVPLIGLCSCRAHITYVAEKVIEVYTEVVSENLRLNAEQICVTGFFYYVGVDLETHKALPARPLKITSPEEEAAFEAGRLRLEKQLKF